MFYFGSFDSSDLQHCLLLRAHPECTMTSVHFLLCVALLCHTGSGLRDFVQDLRNCQQCFGFGEGVRRRETPELHDQIAPSAFFKNYVHDNQQPVILKGVMRDSPAFRLWQTDEYLLSLDAPPDSSQRVEINKKQDTTKPLLYMHFHDFVDVYHQLPYYMVDEMPTFMRKDMTVPWCLQCDDIKKHTLTDLVIWFSSGGTNGYVHADQLDNVHCVISGNKYFVMLNRADEKWIRFEKPISAASDINVNHVGYDTTRPDLAKIEYWHANISAGDCLFLPYRWVHQVRSFGERHIAFSVWWNNSMNGAIDFRGCNERYNPDQTFADYTIHPKDDLFRLDALKDILRRCVETAMVDGGMTAKMFRTYVYQAVTNDVSNLGDVIRATRRHIRELFRLLDRNSDGAVRLEELDTIPEEDWPEMMQHWQKFKRFGETLSAEEAKANKVNDWLEETDEVGKEEL